MAPMNNSATGTEPSNPRKAPRNRIATTPAMSRAEKVQSPMDHPMIRQRRHSRVISR